MLLLLATNAAAEEWGLPQLMQTMSTIQSATRKFTERKYVSMLTTPLESSGTLLYQAPDRLEKHTLTPREEHMTLDHGVIVLYRPGQGKRTMMVNQYPAVGAFVESMRATLAGDQPTLEHYFEVKLEGNATRWRVQLTPRDQAVRDMVREIHLEGRNAAINSVEILEANGNHSLMTISGDGS
jgi:outer membrane lipoprotein-sorting protein